MAKISKETSRPVWYEFLLNENQDRKDPLGRFKLFSNPSKVASKFINTEKTMNKEKMENIYE